VQLTIRFPNVILETRQRVILGLLAVLDALVSRKVQWRPRAATSAPTAAAGAAGRAAGVVLAKDDG
jgi:hypothetical protein